MLLLLVAFRADISAVDVQFTIGVARGHQDVSRGQHVEILACFTNRSDSETVNIFVDYPEEIRADFVFWITDPSGKEIVLRQRQGVGSSGYLPLPPGGGGEAKFDMSRLYNFAKFGTYILTAEYLYRENNGPVIKTFRSNPLSVTVVDPSRIQWGTEIEKTQFGICQSETVPQTVLVFLRSSTPPKTNAIQTVADMLACERLHPLTTYFGSMALASESGGAVTARVPEATNCTNFPSTYRIGYTKYQGPGEHLFKVGQLEQLVEAIPVVRLFETATNSDYRFTFWPKFYKHAAMDPGTAVKFEAPPLTISLKPTVAKH